MLSIPSTNVSWPTSPPSQAVAPTQPVAPVSGSQSGNNSPQAGLGYGQEGHGLRADATATDDSAVKETPKTESSAAPLLPRHKSEQGKGQAKAEQSEETVNQEERDRIAQAQQDELERSKALREQLREVLSNVWQASAAVVDRALGGQQAANDTSVDGVAAADSSGATGEVRSVEAPAAMEAAQLDASVLPAESGAVDNGSSAEEVPLVLLGSGKVESYDEKGHGSTAPVPPGVLVNQRA